MTALSRIIRALATPGVGSPYVRGVIFIAHAMVGAAFVSALGLYGLGPAIVIALLYATLKERGDIRRGGGKWDSVEDTLAVAMGALYGSPWWPVAVLLTGFGVMVAAEARK